MLNQKSDRALLWIVACAFFMQTLDTTIVNTALPSIARSFNETAFAMRPVVVAYSLTMAMLMPASGWLADRFGTRRVYFTAILLFVLGSLACACANSLDQLVFARILQGIGGSMLLPVGRLAVLRSVPAAQYIAALAFVSVAGQIGPVLGPVMGGILVEAASWHWIFLINLPIGLIGVYAVGKFLADDPAKVKPKFDFVDYGLLSFAMLALCLSFDAPVATHRAEWAAGLFAAGLAAVFLYVRHAKRSTNPLFELSLFKKANFSVGLVGNLVCRVGSSAVPFLLPLLFQVQMGFTPLHAGLSMLPLAIAGAFSKRWISPLIDYFGFETFLVGNTLIVGASIMSFAAFSQQWPVGLAIVQLMIFGSANSMQYAAMNGVTLKGLKGSDASSGNSLFSMVQMVAMGLGATAGGGLVGVFSSSLDSTGAAFCWTFLCVGLVTFFSAFIFTRLDQSALSAPLRKSRHSDADTSASTT
jgi:DHA2 family multidrug resistance protein-like MFS transporter